MPAMPRSMNDCVTTAKSQPEAKKDRKDTQGFTPNRNLTRTPPQQMPTKTDRTQDARQNTGATAKASSISTEPRTIAQNPGKDAQTEPPKTKNTEKKAPSTTNEPSPNEGTQASAEHLMAKALQQLQEIYNNACRSNADQIVIQRPAFEKIATTFQQAYQQIKSNQSNPVPENDNRSIFNILHQIQARLDKLENLQTANNVSETKPKAKTYANTPKPPVTAAELQIQQEKEEIRAQKIRSTIILDTSKTSEDTEQWFKTQQNETIATTVQNAIETQLQISCAILEIKKQPNMIKILHCMSDEDTNEVLTKMNWSEIADGLELHEAVHGVIVHKVPKHIDLTDPQTIELFKEANHCSKHDAITHITPLRRNPTDAAHHSIIVFGKHTEELNKWLERGFSINYKIYRTDRYTTRAQLVQCFNCYGYGHYAKNCTAATRCGKCGDSHQTQICENTQVKCCQCEGHHESWHYKCPIRIAMWKKLREKKHLLPFKFIESNHISQESDSEGNELPTIVNEVQTPSSDPHKSVFAPQGFPTSSDSRSSSNPYSVFGHSSNRFSVFGS